ncbi:MAG: ribonuclease HIII [Kiritimatiellia bacterium]
MVKRNSFTYKLDSLQQEVLSGILRQGNYRLAEVPYASIAAKTEDCVIALYKSGKCVAQGKGAEDFVTFVLEPLVLKQAALGYEDVLDPDISRPHLGVDESGKGDFFGPMVTAAAYVDKTLVDAMREMNVRDSKSVSTDKKAMDMGRDIRKLLDRRFSVVRIGPRSYNALYAKMRSVNAMLAWAHARAIENLLEIVPECPRAVADQFGVKSQVRNALMRKGREIELVQKHRAESDIAVAAASILARAEFVHSLKKMEKEYELPFPKGASSAVKDSASKLIEKMGAEILLETSKCHFKTTDDVLRRQGLSRQDLPPDGQVVSKAARNSGDPAGNVQG